MNRGVEAEVEEEGSVGDSRLKLRRAARRARYRAAIALIALCSTIILSLMTAILLLIRSFFTPAFIGEVAQIAQKAIMLKLSQNSTENCLE